MFDSLLYVSRNLLVLPPDAAQLSDIQMVSLARNSLLGLTGVLIATPGYFTQYLEGDHDALATVMRAIRADARHTDIFVAEIVPADAPRFPNWAMACFAPGSFTSRHVEPVLERHHGTISAADAARLIAFMTEIAPETGRARSAS